MFNNILLFLWVMNESSNEKNKWRTQRKSRWRKWRKKRKIKMENKIERKFSYFILLSWASFYAMDKITKCTNIKKMTIGNRTQSYLRRTYSKTGWLKTNAPFRQIYRYILLNLNAFRSRKDVGGKRLKLE